MPSVFRDGSFHFKIHSLLSCTFAITLCRSLPIDDIDANVQMMFTFTIIVDAYAIDKMHRRSRIIDFPIRIFFLSIYFIFPSSEIRYYSARLNFLVILNLGGLYTLSNRPISVSLQTCKPTKERLNFYNNLNSLA